MGTLVEKGSEVINFDIRPPSKELEKLLEEGQRKITFVQGNILDLPTLISCIKEKEGPENCPYGRPLRSPGSNRLPYLTHQVGGILQEMVPGARIEIGLELNEYEKKDAARRGKLDISSAKAELGFEPRFPLRQAIQGYMETYRKYHPG